MPWNVFSRELIDEFRKPYGAKYITSLVTSGYLSIHAVDQVFGNGLLHFAVDVIKSRDEFYGFLQFFLAHGGALNAVGKNGKTALDLCPLGDARGDMHWKTQALVAYGAKHGSVLRPLVSISAPDIHPAFFDTRAIREEQARRRQAEFERRLVENAYRVLEDSEGLFEYVKAELLPNLLRIRTRTGIYGMGFFQHGEWLVSNAHVLACPELLEEATFFDVTGQARGIEIKRSFHRPAANAAAPDLVVLNCVSGSARGLPPWFTEDSGTRDIYFYISVGPEAGSNPKIKRLQKISRAGSCPDIYKCIDPEGPLPGESGSPIFAARVVANKHPRWEACVVGALYARCSPVWYNTNPDVRTVIVSEDQLLVCAVPVASDFKQLLHTYLWKEQQAIRFEQIGDALTQMDGNLGRPLSREAIENIVSARQARQEMARGLHAFCLGMTPLSIRVPLGLDKVLGRNIVPLGRSMLLGKKVASQWRREREITVEPTRLLDKKTGKGWPSFLLADLETDFEVLLKQVNDTGAFALKASGTNSTIFRTTNFRIDQVGCTGGGWRLEVQDNTDGWYARRSPSLSCTFAIALVAVDQRSSLRGDVLKATLKASQQAGKPKNYSIDHLMSEAKPDPVIVPVVPASLMPYECTSNRPLGPYEAATDLDRQFQRILESRFCLRVQSIVKDGHCQFRAVAYELHRHGHFMRHDLHKLTRLVRKTVVNYMKSPPGRLELASSFSSAECNDMPDYDSYLTQMSNPDDPKAQGSEITARALGEIFWTKCKLPVIILDPADFQEGRTLLLRHRVFGCSNLAELDFKRAIFLVYDGGTHYDTIVELSPQLYAYLDDCRTEALADAEAKADDGASGFFPDPPH